MKSLRYFESFIFLIIISLSCTKNPTSVENSNYFGAISVDVRALQYKSMVLYSDGSKDIPRYPVILELKIKDPSSNSFVTLESKLTDNQGYTSFDSLEYNIYYIYPQIDSNIGYIWPDSIEINQPNLTDTARVGVSYNWNLSQHDFEISIDTTSLNPDSLQLHDRIFFLYNNGVRDTLFCEFDTSEVPEWLYFEINKRRYIPMYPATVDHWIHTFFWSHDIPHKELPMSFSVPVTHQFGTEDLNFSINLKE